MRRFGEAAAAGRAPWVLWDRSANDDSGAMAIPGNVRGRAGPAGAGAPGLVEARKDDKPAAKEKDEAEPVDVTDLGTAFQLVEYGRAYDAPESLIMAAGLLRVVARAELKELDVKVEVEGADKDKEKDAQGGRETGPEEGSQRPHRRGRGDDAKQKTNLSALIKVLQNRKLPTGSAGVVKYLGRTVEGGRRTSST